MRKIIIFSVALMVCICVLMAGCVSNSVEENIPVQVIPTDKVPLNITYYYSPTCSYCTLMSEDFDKLEENHHGEFVLTKHKVQDDEPGFFKLMAYYNVSPLVPFIIVGDKTFSGYNKTYYSEIEFMIENR